MRSTMRRTSGRKPMSSMRSTSIEDQHLNRVERDGAVTQEIRSTARRGDHDVDPFLQPFPVACHSPRHRGPGSVAQTGVRRCTPSFQMPRPLAPLVRAWVPGSGSAACRVRPASTSSAGRRAAVLPVPVCEAPITSLPASTTGAARDWISVGVAYPGRECPRAPLGKLQSLEGLGERPLPALGRGRRRFRGEPGRGLRLAPRAARVPCHEDRVPHARDARLHDARTFATRGALHVAAARLMRCFRAMFACRSGGLFHRRARLRFHFGLRLLFSHQSAF